MSARTYCNAHFDHLTGEWVLSDVEPHVSIALKHNFRGIRASATSPYRLKATPDLCSTLYWFSLRYPFNIKKSDLSLLKRQDKDHKAKMEERERVFTPARTSQPTIGIRNVTPRPSQEQAAELSSLVKRMLLADTQGLGKTLSAILAMLRANVWPAAVVVDTQILLQWKAEIENYTSLRVHIIKATEMYELPEADIYLFRYGILHGWTEIFAQGAFPFVTYDEIASLRRGTESEKGAAAKVLSDHAEYVLGLSGTPVYNYGNEIFNIIHYFIRPDCLGSEDEFTREWCNPDCKKKIKDPRALGAYLREIHVMLRRERKDVLGTDKLPLIEVHEVDYNDKEAHSFEQRMKELAMSTLGANGSISNFADAGQFSLQLRQLTGIVKAKQVAMYVRMIVASGEPVILTAWHREVHEIYMRELRDFNPVLFTGSETMAQKEKNKNAFINGETDLLILSLRSGIGVDGFQKRCAYLVFGELDFSPQIHSQVITRIDRPGQLRDVTILFLVCNFGSDPVMQALLGLKRSQSDGILNPFNNELQNVNAIGNDEGSRVKLLAINYLTQMGVPLPEKIRQEKIIESEVA